MISKWKYAFLNYEWLKLSIARGRQSRSLDALSLSPILISHHLLVESSSSRSRMSGISDYAFLNKFTTPLASLIIEDRYFALDSECDQDELQLVDAHCALLEP